MTITLLFNHPKILISFWYNVLFLVYFLQRRKIILSYFCHYLIKTLKEFIQYTFSIVFLVLIDFFMFLSVAMSVCVCACKRGYVHISSQMPKISIINTIMKYFNIKYEIIFEKYPIILILYFGHLIILCLLICLQPYFISATFIFYKTISLIILNF